MAPTGKINGTAIVLAGGQSKRFGSNKALAEWKDVPLIGHVVATLTTLFPEILIVTKDPNPLRFLEEESGVRVIRDVIQEQHPMGGIYSGLIQAETDYSFVCGCDMPLLEEGLIASLWEMRTEYDAVVPQWNQRKQPLCAVYSSRCLPAIGHLLDQDRKKLLDLFGIVKTLVPPEARVKRDSPNGLSFQDIDSVQDYQRILSRLP